MPHQPPARSQPAILPPLLSLTLLWALGGCADGGAAYPSLARRPVERITDAVPVATASSSPGADARPSAELAGRLDQMLGQARGAKQDFDERQAAAERLIAAAGSAPAGSEEWARATQALSGLESARSQTAQPLSDLDRLDVDDRLQGAQLSPEKTFSPPDTAAIAQARAAITALVADEDAVLAKLDTRLGR